jgi:hypothetical protein
VKSIHVVILVAVIAVAAVAGLLVKGQEKEPAAQTPRAAAQPPETQPALPPGHPPANTNPQMPPGHPPIDPTQGHPPMPQAPQGEGAGLTWKLPAKWKEVPSASSMRLATFKIDDAEMSVIRAGGSTKANVDRWIGQFAQGAESKQTERTVKGLKVTIVEVKGTYSGGMMMGGGEAKANQALLGAVVETPPDAHFFKMTGPEKTVLGARADFDAFVSSLEPKK